MFLSSTFSVAVLRVVVVPFTVRFPPTVTFPTVFMEPPNSALLSVVRASARFA